MKQAKQSVNSDSTRPAPGIFGPEGKKLFLLNPKASQMDLQGHASLMLNEIEQALTQLSFMRESPIEMDFGSLLRVVAAAAESAQVAVDAITLHGGEVGANATASKARQ